MSGLVLHQTVATGLSWVLQDFTDGYLYPHTLNGGRNTLLVATRARAAQACQAHGLAPEWESHVRGGIRWHIAAAANEPAPTVDAAVGAAGRRAPNELHGVLAYARANAQGEVTAYEPPERDRPSWPECLAFALVVDQITR